MFVQVPECSLPIITARLVVAVNCAAQQLLLETFVREVVEVVCLACGAVGELLLYLADAGLAEDLAAAWRLLWILDYVQADGTLGPLGRIHYKLALYSIL